MWRWTMCLRSLGRPKNRNTDELRLIDEVSEVCGREADVIVWAACPRQGATWTCGGRWGICRDGSRTYRGDKERGYYG